MSDNLIKKADYYPDQKEYGGLFSYTEIIQLINEGAKPAGYTNDLSYYENLVQQKKSGKEYFYFTLDFFC